MRVRGRVDGNQKAVVEALRRVGCLVLDLSRVGHGCPDLLVQCRFGIVLMEVKTARGKLTHDQVLLMSDGWRVFIVRSVSEALALVGIDG